MVVTVWDLLHKIFPKQLDPHGDWGEQIRRTIESADALICISNNTKRDLLHYYSVNEEKVKVIPLATNFDLPDKKGIEGTRSVSSTNRYFAFVGGRYGYKNFLLTLEAFAKLCESLSDLKLVVAGSAFTKQEQEDVARLRISEKIEHFLFPDDLTLRDIYQNSIALLYPSAYEGFGLPPLEALQSQTTVIAANASSLPEVIGDAGILLDRMDRDSLVDAMHYLANDDRARKNLIAKASSQSKQFSWEATTEKTVALYRSLAN